MKLVKRLLLAAALVFGAAAGPALCADNSPLFVNMTTDDPHRANMAISFSSTQMERGHPLTVFLNDKGVLVGSKANAGKYSAQQKALSDMMAKGAAVIACPMCMQHYGVKEADLLPGIKVGKPELTGAALFKDDTRTLSW